VITTDPDSPTTSELTVTETPSGEDPLTPVTVAPGETVKTGKTTVTNDNPGVTLDHDTTGVDDDGNPSTG
ncbi:hypothetical protein, partial [Paucilactobacillus suebicus]|uniref:hypothetical protein n=1 Tax=Paucilactobacillus suebicus TaxID=152335 RepID=UPI000248FEBF